MYFQSKEAGPTGQAHFSLFFCYTSYCPNGQCTSQSVWEGLLRGVSIGRGEQILQHSAEGLLMVPKSMTLELI